ncbi:MAG: hypothetical protein JWN04_3806 [Myxococcaceae bacterium]|nr:hypothetical protein [Myxococcaceae bacterium]
MRRILFSALFLSSVVSAAACGDSSKVVSDGNHELADGGRGSANKDGGKLGSTVTRGPDGGVIVTLPPVMLTPTSEPFSKDATGTAHLPAADIAVLKAGGASCTAKVLYPYDKTVFPAGLTPPTIMWDGASDGAYLKLTYEGLDTLSYEAAAGAAAKGELDIDPADWNEIVRRTQGSDMLVTLSTKQGKAVSTCNFTWTIAQGAMTGSVFYNTYDSPDNSGEGAVVRLTLGQAQSDVYLKYQGGGISSGTGPCISCHSVSANGASLAASLHNYSIGQWSYKASSYQVSATPEPAPITDLPESTFGAFTPDGTRILSIGNPDCTNGSNSFPRSPNNFPLVPGPNKATLYDTKTGAVVPAQGLNAGWFMWMPQFSPKGDMVAFNHAKIGADGRTDRRELAVMKFDPATNTFGELKVVVTNQGPAPSIDYAPMAILGVDAPNAGNNCNTNTPSNVGAIRGGTCSGPCYPAWPFFTPDGEGIVYSLVSEPDFMSAFPGRDTPSKSELWYVDIDTQTKVRLDVANKGLGDDDSLSNYYPTMLPVQVGGYYWMFWTSTRPWGHRDFTSTTPGGGVIGSIFGNQSSSNATKKRIWVSAIKPRQINEAGEAAISDTSAPGFYLEGQSNSGNVRAFATLNPCQQQGSDCTSGLDCCTGYCNIPDGADHGSCVPEKSCSDVNEKCTNDSNCCPAADGQQQRLCIGDYCGFQAL